MRHLRKKFLEILSPVAVGESGASTGGSNLLTARQRFMLDGLLDEENSELVDLSDFTEEKELPDWWTGTTYFCEIRECVSTYTTS